jgi:hypothetical protein
MTIEKGWPDSFPAFRLLRRQEAVFSACGGTVGDTEVRIDAVQDISLDLAVPGLGDGDVVADLQARTVLGRLIPTAAGHCDECRKKKS